MADQIGICDVSEEAPIRSMTLDTGEDQLNKQHYHIMELCLDFHCCSGYNQARDYFQYIIACKLVIIELYWATGRPVGDSRTSSAYSSFTDARAQALVGPGRPW